MLGLPLSKVIILLKNTKIYIYIYWMLLIKNKFLRKKYHLHLLETKLKEVFVKKITVLNIIFCDASILFFLMNKFQKGIYPCSLLVLCPVSIVAAWWFVLYKLYCTWTTSPTSHFPLTTTSIKISSLRSDIKDWI